MIGALAIRGASLLVIGMVRAVRAVECARTRAQKERARWL